MLSAFGEDVEGQNSLFWAQAVRPLNDIFLRRGPDDAAEIGVYEYEIA